MLVLVLGCVFLVLLIPLAIWALLAMTTWAGLALAVGLVICGAGWVALMAGWVWPDQVANTVLLLALLTPALIMAGRLADRVAVVGLAPSARLRLITAHSLVAACVCLNVAVFVVLIVGALYAGWSYTPPNSDVLPLPAALSVLSDQAQTCGSPAGCGRDIDVKSATGLSADQTVQVVAEALIRLHGWRLGTPPYQGGCRHEGWLLGREEVCVSVQPSQNTAQVVLQDSGP